MSTIVTRALSGRDTYDLAAIKTDQETYKDPDTGKGLTGLLELVITNYSWADGGSPSAADAGTIDIRVPNYNPNNDTPVVDNVSLTQTSGGPTSVAKKYYFAVNSGQPGPSIFVQGDGTWDLMNIVYNQPDKNELSPTTVTVTYTLTFTDLTPSSAATPDATVTLTVDNTLSLASTQITAPSSTYTAKNGYVQFDFVSLDVEGTDVDPLAFDANGNKTGIKGDSVPLFQVLTSPIDIQPLPAIIHPTTKNSGKKTYTKNRYIFAINIAKVDQNGTNNATTVSFCNVALQKIAEWQCDDVVVATLNYKMAFTEKT